MESVYFKLYLCFWLTLSGACIGSFLNVMAYRLPKGNFLSQARSYCPACNKTLGWRDLVPIVSWLSLKGRCRYCGSRISPRYPLVEAVCAALAILCFARFGFGSGLILAFGASSVLLAIALIDHDTMEIPDRLILALVPFSICASLVWRDVSLTQRTIGFFAVSLPMLLLSLVIDGAFGGGDIKLIAVCGFLLGWKNVLSAFFIALLTGGGYAIYLLVSGKGKRGGHIAFGPYICAGAAAALFYGDIIIEWYLDFFRVT